MAGGGALCAGERGIGGLTDKIDSGGGLEKVEGEAPSPWRDRGAGVGNSGLDSSVVSTLGTMASGASNRFEGEGGGGEMADANKAGGVTLKMGGWEVVLVNAGFGDGHTAVSVGVGELLGSGVETPEGVTEAAKGTCEAT